MTTSLMIAAIVALNAIALALCQVPLTLQLGVWAYSAWLTALGSILLRPLRATLPDRVTYYLLSFLLSLVCLFGLTFVLFHRAVLMALGLDDLGDGVLVANGLYALVAGVGWMRTRRAAPPPAMDAFGTRPLPWLLLLAAALAAATYYGKLNEQLHAYFPQTNEAMPNWAHHDDARIHLAYNTKVLAEHGYPPSKLAHRGLQQTVVSYFYVVGDGTLIDGTIKIAKTLTGALYFATLYLTFVIAAAGYGVRQRYAALAAVATVLFAPISTSPFSLAYTSYRAGISSGCAFYHSATQLFSVPIALGGIVLLLESLKTRLDARFVWGCVLVAGSFFFKPSAFSVIAPTICAILLLSRRSEVRYAAPGALVLFCVPALWLIYPAIFDTITTELHVRLEPFRAKLLVSKSALPAALRSSSLTQGAAVVLGSFAAFFPLVFDRARAAVVHLRSRGVPPLELLRRGRHHLLLVLPVVLGVAAALLLVDRNRAWNSNFGWGAATGIVLFMPALVSLAAGRLSTPLRWTTWSLLGLHLWAGLQHLVHFVLTSSLRPGMPE